MLVNELRNYHVKKLLTKLGGNSVDLEIQKAIKKSFSEFAEDVNQKDTTHGQHITDGFER
jgi:hypothetical protein